MASAKRNYFQLKKWFTLNELTATENSSSKGDAFHWKEWVPLKGMSSSYNNDFHWKEQRSIKSTASSKNNGIALNDLPINWV